MNKVDGQKEASKGLGFEAFETETIDEGSDIGQCKPK